MTLPKHHIALGLAMLALVAACDARERPTVARTAAPTSQWIDPAKLQPGPIRHERLTAEQVERITKVQATFKDVDPSRVQFPICA